MATTPQKVVLITGASKGLGKVTGSLLQSKGYKVYGTARHPERYPGHPFPLLALDLEDEVSVHRVVDELLDKEGRIDVLINNAGRGMMGPLEESPSQAVKTLFQTNLFGMMELTRRVLPHMRRRGEGYVIIVSSVAGFAGLPYRGAYSASKAAVMIIAETLRYELYGSGIRVVDVCPGDIITDIAAGRIYAPVKKNSPYYAAYERIRRATDSEVHRGLPPEKVARQIEKILRNPSPRPRYIVAPFTQKILPLIKALLPGKWFESIIRKHYKIS